MKNGNALLIALGTGLAIGGLLGVLYAPNKGKDTREQIRKRSQRLRDNVRDRFQHLKEDTLQASERVEEEYA